MVMIMSACGPQAAATPTTAPAATSAGTTATQMTTGFSVGVVLPTKDEPRCIQDKPDSKMLLPKPVKRSDPLQPG